MTPLHERSIYSPPALGKAADECIDAINGCQKTAEELCLTVNINHFDVDYYNMAGYCSHWVETHILDLVMLDRVR
ncbi:hypothetical protein A2U01_0061725 [Trifolium medium]|uniref:Uncharacterized protein n=1 Tax=Trifolium medium TaxID=97028 RepID=A0A392RWF6_9FABA|nr:hypothetical protein [Trifolium medium]